MTKYVTAEVDRGVCTVTLCDEERRNALSVDLVGDLMETLDEAEADNSVRVIVLTNTGTVFCAGADLSERTGRAPGSNPRKAFATSELFSRFVYSSKPYVGRIAGHAVAGGIGLAAAMDISIAVDHAKMGFTEVRIGVAPAMISVLCLPKMQAAEARAALLRGNRFLAPEAARMGLINAAVPEADLDAEVAAVVADLVAGGPNALAATKRLLAQVPTMSLGEAFEWTSSLSAELFRSPEGQEGMAAYLEKRPAAWIPTS